MTTETNPNEDNDISALQALDVLVVEDNLLNQKVVAAFLEHLGHRCTLVGDGIGALDLITHGSFDVALIDIQIPALNGMDLVKRLRSSATGSGHPRLVAVTALARADGTEFYRANGFDSYLSKPLTIAMLKAELTQD